MSANWPRLSKVKVKSAALFAGLLLALGGNAVAQGIPPAAGQRAEAGASGEALRLNAEQLAGALIAARRQGQVLDILAHRHPALGLGQAYAIQDAMLRRKLAAGDRQAGWKIARSRVDLLNPGQPPTPTFGHVMASDVLPNGHAFSGQEFGGIVMVEVETVLWINKDLPQSSVSREELLGAIGAVGGAIEVAANRVSIDPFRLHHVVADNNFHAGVIFTDLRKPVKEVNFSREGAKAAVNGQARSDGWAADIMDDGPVAAALWLVNELPKHGHQVKAGDFIITGSMLVAPLLRSGETATASYTSFGELSVSIN